MTQPSRSGDWLSRYNESHRHPVNRACHVVGIPMIILGVLLGLGVLVYRPLWPVPLALFIGGWVLQFIGHAIEGKPPAFLSDWRFLFTGAAWWLAKLRRPRR